MKKYTITIIAIIMISMLHGIIPIPALASAPIRVFIDDWQVEFADQEPILVEGRVLVPVRGVFEMLGFDVSWNPQTSQVILAGSDVIILTIGSSVFTTNGAAHILDVPAQIIGGRTMLPLRLVLESLGVGLGWNPWASAVIITSNEAQIRRLNQPDPTVAKEVAWEQLVGVWDATDIQGTNMDLRNFNLVVFSDGLVAFPTVCGSFNWHINGNRLNLFSDDLVYSINGDSLTLRGCMKQFFLSFVPPQGDEHASAYGEFSFVRVSSFLDTHAAESPIVGRWDITHIELFEGGDTWIDPVDSIIFLNDGRVFIGDYHESMQSIYYFGDDKLILRDSVATVTLRRTIREA